MKYRDELVEKLKEVVVGGRPRVSAIHRSEWPQLWGVIDLLVETHPESSEDEIELVVPTRPSGPREFASLPLLDLDSRTVREVEVEFDETGRPKSFREIEGES